MSDVKRHIGHEQVGALAGSQRGQGSVDIVHVGDLGAALQRDLSRGRDVTVQCAYDEKPHGGSPECLVI